MKHRFYIDTHKGVTPLVIVALIAAYGAWENPVAWIYLGMHGTYALLWLIKSLLFGDASWERKVRLRDGASTWVGMSAYWAAPWLIVSGHGGEPPPWLVGLCVAVYSVGVFLHFVSDMQKHLSLRFRPGTLITEGPWGVVRNPNYLGELLIYLGFGLLAASWIPVAIIAAIVAAYWYPNMRRKDKSLSRYPEFADYKARTKLWIPCLA